MDSIINDDFNEGVCTWSNIMLLQVHTSSLKSCVNDSKQRMVNFVHLCNTEHGDT